MIFFFFLRSIIPKITQWFVSLCGLWKYIYMFGDIALELVSDLKDEICLNKKSVDFIH